MAQTDSFVLGNVPGSTFRQNLNEILAALQSTNSGSSAPTVTAPGMLWFDTTVPPGIQKIRNGADDAWLVVPFAVNVATSAQGDRADTASQPDQYGLINSAFEFWQRAASGTINGYAACDRWANSCIGGTVTQSAQAFALGTKLGKNNPKYHLRQTVAGQSTAAHVALTLQKIMGVRNYAGETITILGWAKRFSGAGNIAFEATQDYGTGGSPSAAVIGIGTADIALTTSWEPFAVTIDVPSITGKTIGNNGNDSFNVLFWTSAGADFNARSGSLGVQTIAVDLWGIHIKHGTHSALEALNYVQPPEDGIEFARCQQFYEIGTFFTQSAAGTVGFGGVQGFNTRKRGVPSLSGTIGNSFNVNTIGYQAISTQGMGMNAVATGAGAFFFWNWAADAEL